jgi:hypothetical protein
MRVRPRPRHSIVLFVVFVVVVVAWINSVGIFSMWLQVEQRAEMSRTGMFRSFQLYHPAPESYPPPFTPRTYRLLDLREKLFGHMLSQDDVRILTPGAAITPRRYPIVDFVLAPLLPPMQRGSG